MFLQSVGLPGQYKLREPHLLDRPGQLPSRIGESVRTALN
jgi:hypothetical protein